MYLKNDVCIEPFLYEVLSWYLLIESIIKFFTVRSVSVLVGNHCAHLQELHLDGDQLEDNTLHTISKCHQLSILVISFAELFTDQAIVAVKVEIVKEFMEDLCTLSILLDHIKYSGMYSKSFALIYVIDFISRHYMHYES